MTVLHFFISMQKKIFVINEELYMLKFNVEEQLDTIVQRLQNFRL